MYCCFVLTHITFYATIATTKKLIASPYGWYYQACHSCPKVARIAKPPFLFEDGHSTEAKIFWYHYFSCNILFYYYTHDKLFLNTVTHTDLGIT